MAKFDDEKLFNDSVSWRAVTSALEEHSLNADSLNFSGKILCGAKYAGKNLAKVDFSAANLRDADFSKANLEGANFTSADLSGANLREANLNGAVFSDAILRSADFTGAKMNGVILQGADIQDAILLDVEMDQIALDELQALVEWLAIYYPHKLNLRRLNLALLDISRIDLRAVDLRGVDLTGVNFTGVNIWELDLSETNITPEQIAQALGRPPTEKELKQIMAPKRKKKKFKGVDLTSFFDGRGTAGVWDLTKHPGITVATLLTMGKKVYTFFVKKPELEDQEILDKFYKSRNLTDEKEIQKQQKEINEIMENRREVINKEIRESKPVDENKGKDYDFDDAMTDSFHDDRVRGSGGVDLTDYEYERNKRAKENKIKESREKYRENSKRFQESAREMYAYSRSHGQRERG